MLLLLKIGKLLAAFKKVGVSGMCVENSRLHVVVVLVAVDVVVVVVVAFTSKTVQSLYPVPSSVGTDPTLDAVDCRGHRLSYPEGVYSIILAPRSPQVKRN